MDKVRCAVIGAGGFAEVCHVPGLQSHPQAEVVLLCGRNEDRRREMAERLGVPETSGDYRDVVARPERELPWVEQGGAVGVVGRAEAVEVADRPEVVGRDHEDALVGGHGGIVGRAAGPAPGTAGVPPARPAPAGDLPDPG